MSTELRWEVDQAGTLTLTDGVWRWTLPGYRMTSEAGLPQMTAPPPAPPGQSQPHDRAWDLRLDARGVRLVSAPVAPGQTYWRLIRADYRDRSQAQGKHHIYIDLRDGEGRLEGVKVTVWWPGGSTEIRSEAKPGEEAACNFPMFAAGSAYNLRVDGVSDEVHGMGLGDIGSTHMAEHVAYFLVFQRTVAR